MPGQETHPVKILREYAVALEAALTVCLADPSHKPVHRLRTETRRVEAQLLLLAQMPELPEHRKQTERLRLALKRLRQAAGEVRDLDVHRKRLDGIAGDGSAAGNEQTEAASPDDTQAALREGAAALRDHLKSRRESMARSLQGLLEKHGSKAARATEKLLKVLQPAEGASMPEDALLRQAEAVFSHPGLLTNRNPDDLTEDELHTVRKAAKAARYLAETLPVGGAESGKAVGRFERLQEFGGQWHDALELARAAKSFLGRRHALTETIAAERDRRLQLYREVLAVEAGFSPAGGVSPSSRRASTNPGPPKQVKAGAQAPASDDAEARGGRGRSKVARSSK